MNKIIIFLFLLFAIKLPFFAQTGISFIAETPKVIYEGEQFRLKFSLIAWGREKDLDVEDFVPPSFEGFEVLMGPSRSLETNFDKNKKNKIVNYTYILKASKKGCFYIDAAKVTINNVDFTSDAITIKVLPIDETYTKPSSSASDTVFVKAITDKLAIYVNESFKLTYKVYTTLRLINIEEISFPFKNFKPTLKSKYPDGEKYVLESYDGKNYFTIVYRRFTFSPITPGLLTIGAACLNAEYEANFLETFFNEKAELKRRKVCVPEVAIEVYPLPIEMQSISNVDAEQGIRLYKNGNYVEALPLLQRAAKSGNIPSLSYLGNIYLLGLGVGKNYTNAMNMYRRGADNGSAFCKLHQGIMYYNGWGVIIDKEKALSLFRQAANQGSSVAHFILSCLYDNGNLVNRDEKKAQMHRKIYDNLGGGFMLKYNYTHNIINVKQ